MKYNGKFEMFINSIIPKHSKKSSKYQFEEFQKVIDEKISFERKSHTKYGGFSALLTRLEPGVVCDMKVPKPNQENLRDLEHHIIQRNSIQGIPVHPKRIQSSRKRLLPCFNHSARQHVFLLGIQHQVP